MNLLRRIIHAYLYLPFCLERLTGRGAFGKDRVVFVPMPASSDDVGLKKALVRHYVRQYHEASCSVASVVMAVNALRSGESGLPNPVSQLEILDQVRVGHWRERMGEQGYRGRRGLPLPLLGEVVEGSLAAYGVRHAGVETIRASLAPDEMPQIEEALIRHLTDFELRGSCLVIAHFNQGAYVPALSIPHISPVGGYEIPTRRVTVLDVDPSQQAPYQISFQRFYRGMARPYPSIFRRFGYLNGGFVVVRLE